MRTHVTLYTLIPYSHSWRSFARAAAAGHSGATAALERRAELGDLFELKGEGMGASGGMESGEASAMAGLRATPTTKFLSASGYR
jgi:hypothetical protein